MQKRIEDIVNAQSQTKCTIALFPVGMKVGKQKNVLWAISTGLCDAPQVTSLLKSAKMLLLSFHFWDSGGRRGPQKVGGPQANRLHD